MSTSTASGYHHGDLRRALLTSAMELLEEGEAFSLRAIARRAGVSPTAPYRHFPDREAIESALATQGLQDLLADLTREGALPATADELADIAVGYVDFALRRPGLFRLMFGRECDESDTPRVQAAADLHDLLGAVMAHIFPGQDAEALASGGWALAHGLACLYLDGKLTSSSPADRDAQVRATFHAVLAAQLPHEG